MELMKDIDLEDDETNIKKEDKERRQYIKLLLYNNKDYVIKKTNK